MRVFVGIITAVWLGLTPGNAADVSRLSVVGHGHSASVPDMATISLGVTTQARTAKQALAENSAALVDVLAVVKDAGIEPRNVQTSGLSLSPVWSNRASNSNAAPKVVGFSVHNQVTIRVLDLETLGGLLDQVIANGANQFNGLLFGLQEPGPTLDTARQAAVADALRKAMLYAQAANVDLGPILEISETTSGGNRPVMAREMAMSSPVPIAGGEVGQDASVTVVFSINP